MYLSPFPSHVPFSLFFFLQGEIRVRGGGGGRTRVLQQGLDRFYKFVRAGIVGRRVVARLTPSP